MARTVILTAAGHYALGDVINPDAISVLRWLEREAPNTPGIAGRITTTELALDAFLKIPSNGNTVDLTDEEHAAVLTVIDEFLAIQDTWLDQPIHPDRRDEFLERSIRMHAVRDQLAAAPSTSTL